MKFFLRLDFLKEELFLSKQAMTLVIVKVIHDCRFGIGKDLNMNPKKAKKILFQHISFMGMEVEEKGIPHPEIPSNLELADELIQDITYFMLTLLDNLPLKIKGKFIIDQSEFVKWLWENASKFDSYRRKKARGELKQRSLKNIDRFKI